MLSVTGPQQQTHRLAAACPGHSTHSPCLLGCLSMAASAVTLPGTWCAGLFYLSLMFRIMFMHILCLTDSSQTYACTDTENTPVYEQIWSEMNLFNTLSWHPLFHPLALMALFPSVDIRCITVPLSLVMLPLDYMVLDFDLFLRKESHINIIKRINIYKWYSWNH